MDEPRKDRLRSTIQSRIRALKQQVREKVGDGSDEAGAQAGSPVDSELESAVLQSARQELRLLQENLEWLDHDDGGYCQECGCEIRTARLLVIPTTRHCVACASEKENTG